MKYEIVQTNKFLKELKKMKRRGKDVEVLWNVVSTLARGELLPLSNKDHKLTDSKKYVDVWECHIEPDWLLVYRKDKKNLILLLLHTGTHSDLFSVTL